MPSPTLDEYVAADATAVAARIRSGEWSTADVAAAAATLIEGVDRAGGVNGLVIRAADEERAVGDGPLAGIPIAIKNLLVSAQGLELSNGSELCAGYVPDRDSDVVARLRAAGALIVGRSNTPEFGMSVSTEPLLYGPSRNPWDLSRSVGGSSGGAAALVAARVLPFAHATDSGGSIRIPAAACGVVGFKPSRGLIGFAPDAGEVRQGMTAQLAITRTVRDAALALEIMAEPGSGDRDPGRSLARPEMSPRQLRIGLAVRTFMGNACAGDCVDAALQVARTLETMGHAVEPIDLVLPPDRFAAASLVNRVYTAAQIESFAALVGREIGENSLEPITMALIEDAVKVSGIAYQHAVDALFETSRDMARVFEKIDIILSPTLATLPHPIGTFRPTAEMLANLELANDYLGFTLLFNMSGDPAISLPLGTTADGLPVGVQLAAARGSDGLLLALAAALEEAMPWSTRMPAITREFLEGRVAP
jgi:Asp-tRNA(Asn)/Glu-tRNA(Gln) amidotransferase A subunit family amidase